MIEHNICEALYALPGGVVEPRRQPVCKPILATIVGAVLLFINFVDLLFGGILLEGEVWVSVTTSALATEKTPIEHLKFFMYLAA